MYTLYPVPCTLCVVNLNTCVMQMLQKSVDAIHFQNDGDEKKKKPEVKLMMMTEPAAHLFVFRKFFRKFVYNCCSFFFFFSFCLFVSSRFVCLFTCMVMIEKKMMLSENCKFHFPHHIVGFLLSLLCPPFVFFKWYIIRYKYTENQNNPFLIIFYLWVTQRCLLC